MVLEEFIKKLSGFFSDNESAFYMLDSIAYSGSEMGSKKDKLMEDLKNICQISLSYGEERLRVLQIFDEVCGRAIKNSNYVLSRYYGRGMGISPIRMTFRRLEKYIKEYGKLIDLNDFKAITEQEILLEIKHERKETKKDKNFKKKHVVRSRRCSSCNYFFVF